MKWCDKFKFSYFTMFSRFTSFDEMKILGNSNKILSNIKNLKQALTLSLSSCSPKIKCANEAQGVENKRLYRRYRRRETQGSPNKWFITLRKHYRTLTLPQLIPHFGNLHWRMDNFGLPYWIELRFGT